MLTTRIIRLFFFVLFLMPAASMAEDPLPIIDVHLHAYAEVRPGEKASWAGEPEARALEGAMSATAHRQATLAEMDRYNVVLAVVSGPERAVRAWREHAPDRFIGGVSLGDDGMPEPEVEALPRLVEDDVFGVLGELGLQYQGIRPDDPRLEPYYAAAERLGMPVALHTGLGPPGAPHTFAPEFRTSLGRPALFESVLVDHPDMQAYLMHAGWPYLDETIALMYIYPTLYVDIGVLTWALPTPVFRNTLRQLIDAGFGKRLLFGTDQMVWPGAVGLAIRNVEAVPFLTREQKRDILYNNAARFLRLPKAQIDAHHGR